jgi:hypothetical protein
MDEMGLIIIAMGLYLHMRRDKKEMLEIMQKVSLAKCHLEMSLTSDTSS